MKRFGLLGYPLGHSFSQRYFREKFLKLGLQDHVFDLFAYADIHEFALALKEEKYLCGFSVTIPHKENIIHLLHELDPVAAEIGAVNCVKAEARNGSYFLKGYNTDAFGFQRSVKPFLDPRHERALVLGTGGASKAVSYVLKSIGLDVWFVSRDKSRFAGSNCFTYNEVNREVMEAFKFIVNTTPVGMFPEDELCPDIPYQFITGSHFCYDLIYKPDKTVFLTKAEEKGAMIMNGLDMLYAQADKAWEIWNNA